MVDHQAHLGEIAHGPERRGELPGPHQEVVGQSGVPDGCQPAPDIGAEEPAGIGFVVNLVPDADEPPPA